MNRFLLATTLAGACWAGTAATGDAQVRGRTRTGHVAVGPAGGISAGQTRTAARAGPLGSASGGVHTGTRVTPGGATIQTGSASGARSGPFGASAGAAKGVKVTTPGGQTYSHASSSRAAAGPGGVAVGGSSRTAASGPFGAAGVRRTGGVAFR